VRRAGIALGLFLASLLAAGESVVVLRGGTVIPLKEPWVQKGSTAILTRMDGTLFSVPISEIDTRATAARSKAAPAPPPSITPPPETPAEAVRARREGPKARVRITDADVSHQAGGLPEAPAAKDGGSATAGGASLEVAEYTDQRFDKQLSVRGSLRNVGQVAALSSRLSITILDDKGEVIAKGDAGMGNSKIEPGHDTPFSLVLDVGEKPIASIRFRPIWVTPSEKVAPKGAVPPGSRNGMSAAAAEPAAAPAPAATPQPVPTPYGRGLLYAAPAPPASTSPSPDGKTGYIPGATRKEDQPKPPQ
jgi:hypothetical protein